MKIRKFLTRWKLWTNSAFVTNLGPNLAQGITSTASHNDYLFGNFPQSIFFNLETEHEVIDIASMFQWGKAASYDNISMSVIEQSINCISAPLTHIINLSITHGIFPNEMKIARVLPLFESGDKALFSNYRPFSILPCFSEFWERIVYHRIFCLLNLNEFKILCDNQYGFRKSHSTSLALIDLYEEISSLSMVKNTPLECS